MGDAPGIGCLSLVPLLAILVSIAMAVIAWRSGRRIMRVVAAVVLIGAGLVTVLFGSGLLLSLAAGALIGAAGLALLIAPYRPGGAS